MPLHQFTAAADQATTVTTQLAWRLPHVGMVKQNMANSQSHNAPPMATCVLVRHNCVLLHIASMHLRLHVASGSVNCVAISQVANLLVVQETAVLDWTDEISICQLLLHSLLETQG